MEVRVATGRAPAGGDSPVGSPPVIDLLKAVVLGVIQGLTEFLPISSSAHLRIFPELFGWGDPGAAFTAVIQIGTELAVLIYFRKDIWRIGSAWVRSLFQPEYRGTLDARMGWYIIVGSLPIVVLGVLLKDIIENDFRNLWIIGTTLIVMGVVLGIADRVGRTDRVLGKLTMRDAVLMGAAQAMALIPGVSRSGATIMGGLGFGLDRRTAAEFSFFLAIPTMVAATAYDLYKTAHSLTNEGAALIAAGFAVAFLVAALVVKAAVGFIARHGFAPFAWYRIGAGSLVLLWLALR